MAWVIRYDTKERSGYYRGNGTALPALGATLAETPRYATQEIAQAVLDCFPFMASMCCEVVHTDVGAKKDKQRERSQARRKRSGR